jgi:recombination protein RecA
MEKSKTPAQKKTKKKTKKKSIKKAKPVSEDKVGATKFDDSDVDFGDLCEQIKEDVGDDGSIFIPNDDMDSLISVSQWIPMPTPFLDAIKIKGLPGGHIIEVFGPPDCGKTTICTEALIGAQSVGGIAVLLDTEHKYNFARAREMGLDTDRLIIVRAKTVEEVFNKFKKIVTTIKSRDEWRERLCVFVWDSVAATPCENELDESTKDHNMLAAAALRAGMRRIRYFLDESNVSLMLINQVYDKQVKTAFEKKTTAYGGKAAAYYASLRVEASRVGTVYKQKAGVKYKIGIKTQINVIKNHMAPPFGSAIFEIDRCGIVHNRKADF